MFFCMFIRMSARLASGAFSICVHGCTLVGTHIRAHVRSRMGVRVSSILNLYNPFLQRGYAPNRLAVAAGDEANQG